MKTAKLIQANTFEEIKIELKTELALREKVYSCELEKFQKGGKHWTSLRKKLGHQYICLNCALYIVELVESRNGDMKIEDLELKKSLPQIMSELDREMKMRATFYPKWRKTEEQTRVAISKIQDIKNIVKILHILRVGEQPKLF